ncbi:MAG: phosphonate ABC transporter, permease protein PhnE [Trueperaceae bacterium]|nr:phosphonate ABC transporter, permease protein PhnE [Trueperaceae bacterium]
MPVSLRASGEKVWRQRNPRQTLLNYVGWLIGLVILAISFRFIAGQTLWFFVWDAPAQAADLIDRMFPPAWGYLPKLWKPLWDTINIATLGTLLALIIGVPVAFLAARNTTPHPVVRQIALILIVTSRSVSALIWALLLVSILGPGLLAGILAIALRSIGFCAKLLFEAIEEIDLKPIEALTSTGASGSQVVSYGIVPQVAPAFAGISVYRWDINIRESTVVGLVGAGGIGLQLDASIASLQWPQASVIFVLILGLVVISEWVSAKVRGAIR